MDGARPYPADEERKMRQGEAESGTRSRRHRTRRIFLLTTIGEDGEQHDAWYTFKHGPGVSGTLRNGWSQWSRCNREHRAPLVLEVHDAAACGQR